VLKFQPGNSVKAELVFFSPALEVTVVLVSNFLHGNLEKNMAL
jgi:hypothetical protein